jgi:MFS-type transporter involved in bile tolerance (Atg22 family)
VVADAPFGRYWAAATISSFGTAVTTVAMPVLVIQELHASSIAVGVVNAAQFLPYAVLGLVAGVYADRWRRKRILVWSSLGRAVTLGALPVLWTFDALEVWTLVVLLLAFGGFSVFAFAATQSLLPRLVPRDRLVPANARLDQSAAARRHSVRHSVVAWSVCWVRPLPLRSMRSAISSTPRSTPDSGSMRHLRDIPCSDTWDGRSGRG